MPFKGKSEVHLRVRLDRDLMRRLDAERKTSGRTRSGELKMRLAQSFDANDMAEVVRKAIAENIKRNVNLQRAQELSMQPVSPQWIRYYEQKLYSDEGPGQHQAKVQN